MLAEIEAAVDKKDRARRRRDRGRISEAIRLVDEAVSDLEVLWQLHKQSINASRENASPDERALVGALAECYGVRGGIYRSAGKASKAVESYDRGQKFEAHEANRVDNSYNLIQRLLNRVLVEPQSVGADPWRVLGADMWKELREAQETLFKQITGTRGSDPWATPSKQLTGTRGSDPWAAADTLILVILMSPQSDDLSVELDSAWQGLMRLNPGRFLYESTLRTLKDVRNSLETVAEASRSISWHTVREAIEIVIGRLKDKLPDDTTSP
jgi:hypothetical protein